MDMSLSSRGHDLERQFAAAVLSAKRPPQSGAHEGSLHRASPFLLQHDGGVASRGCQLAPTRWRASTAAGRSAAQALPLSALQMPAEAPH